jgi:hypothetical protein
MNSETGWLAVGAMAAIIVPGLGFVYWLGRLEGKVAQLFDSLKDTKGRLIAMEAKHDDLDQKIVGKLSEILERLARIEGQGSNRA